MTRVCEYVIRPDECVKARKKANGRSLGSSCSGTNGVGGGFRPPDWKGRRELNNPRGSKIDTNGVGGGFRPPDWK